ncbi:P-loop NTPase family protein [Glycomyces dulcitolivorans]|uniref:hypothetical protein n=1 Tax=Glycomyces dulcitolivorans TaxID=2200759 RepID=UPI0013005A77|nr:hypothetical protein [Glycomyces dulcitolivorans]
MDEASILILPWHVAFAEAIENVVRKTGVLPGVAVPIVLALRSRVQACTAANAEALEPQQRQGLSLTDIEHLATSTLELTDQAALTAALRDRLCETIDFDTPMHDDGFYEGVSVQPGHIAAGLPAPRKAATNLVLEALERNRPVLITGPSGVGKSMVLWASGYAARHILWYRVRSLRERDIPALLDLLCASGPTEIAPVGFIIDGVGIGPMREWDTLVERVASIPGARLLGSARFEDLFPLRSLPECDRIEVTLDEEVAARIHQEIVAAGKTTVPHWREAFEQADGLTLEFTHFLTQGRRLPDVIGEQVNKRIAEHRDLELRLLAVTSLAHQWNTAVPLQAALGSAAATDSESRMALERLRQEHLVHVEAGMLMGRHPLRSKTLAEQIHRTPPPMLSDTFNSVTSMIEASGLTDFLAGAVASGTIPDSVILTAAQSRLHDQFGAEGIAVLQGLRAGSLQREMRRRSNQLRVHGVAPAHQIAAFMLAVSEDDLPGMIEPALQVAIDELKAMPSAENALRDDLFAMIDFDQVVATLGRSDITSASTLLALLEELSERQRESLITGTASNSPMLVELATCGFEDLADLLDTAHRVDPRLHAEMVRTLGGEAAITDRLMEYDEWIFQASIKTEEDQSVAFARLAIISPELQMDMEKHAKRIARMYLQCFPYSDHADVDFVAADGQPVSADRPYLSLLKQRYACGTTSSIWPRSRLRYAVAAASVMSRTERTVIAKDLITRSARILDAILKVWLHVEQSRAKKDALNKDLEAFREDIALLTIPFDQTGIEQDGSTASSSPSLHDPLHELLNGIGVLPSRLARTDQYASLAGYLYGTLSTRCREIARSESWETLGDSAPPPQLKALAKMLGDLGNIVFALSRTPNALTVLRAAAAGGAKKHYLARVAGVSSVRIREESERQIQRIEASLRSGGILGPLRYRKSSDTSIPHHLELSIPIEINSLGTELSSAIERCATVLQDAAGPKSLITNVLVVPSRADRPIRRLSHNIAGGRIYAPAIDLFDSWEDQLPRALPTPITDQLERAINVLRELSAIAFISHERPTETRYQVHSDLLSEKWVEAIGYLREIRQRGRFANTIIDSLESLSGVLVAEFEDEENPTAPGFLATQLQPNGNGEPTEISNMCNSLRVMALALDLDLQLFTDHLPRRPGRRRRGPACSRRTYWPTANALLPHHPHTLTTNHDCACWQRQAGHATVAEVPHGRLALHAGTTRRR